MSSGFVSGGTAGEEEERDDDWRNAQRQIEEARRAKEDITRQQDGQSLFEALQANKEKKQAEFEQKARFQLHNALDEDEADYLESLLMEKRRDEMRIKKETLEQLELFKNQQEEAERQIFEVESVEPSKEDPGLWATMGRKRKKAPEDGLLKGIKLRKRSLAAGQPTVVDDLNVRELTAQQVTGQASPPKQLSSAKSSSAPTFVKRQNGAPLTLGYASSDDEEV